MVFDLVWEFFVGALLVAFDWFLGLVPSPPSWVFQAWSGWLQVWSWVETMSTWLPVDLIVTVLGAVFVAWFAATVIHVVRTVISYATFGGGAT